MVAASLGRWPKHLQQAMALATVLCQALVVSATEVPEYRPAAALSGTLNSVGSDTLSNLLSYWSEDFRRFHPGLSLQIQSAGSSTAPTALVEGTADIGPMSRTMKAREEQAFEDRYGYLPTAIPVAIDALAVFVHRDNPLPALTLSELDAMFSLTRRCGHPRPIDRWAQVGLQGGLADQPIALFGRNSVSGTYGYFKSVALCKGDFRPTVLEQPGSATVVQSVATTRNGIGYSGIGYQTASVRAVPIAPAPGEPAVVASAEMAVTGQYPLSRFLYLYVNRPPQGHFSPEVQGFLDMVLSASGQNAVRKGGYIPLPPEQLLLLRQRLGL